MNQEKSSGLARVRLLDQLNKTANNLELSGDFGGAEIVREAINHINNQSAANAAYRFALQQNVIININNKRGKWAWRSKNRGEN